MLRCLLRNSVRLAAVLGVAGVLFVLSGCGPRGEVEPAPSPSTGTASAGRDHGGWWCVEHGVPETDCTMCSPAAATAAKDRGDWCREHERADTQCFVCHPELEAKFAALYEAKYGEKPPARSE
jgi:hypothetical protein